MKKNCAERHFKERYTFTPKIRNPPQMDMEFEHNRETTILQLQHAATFVGICMVCLLVIFFIIKILEVIIRK